MSYYELPDYRDDTEKKLYFLQGKITSTGSPKVIEKIATSAPVKAVKKFNKATAQLLVTSLGFVTALQYNEALKSLLEEGGILEHIGHAGPWVIALVMTVLAYLGAVLMTTLYPEEKVTTRTNPVKTDDST
jgi:hypothetical protein